MQPQDADRSIRRDETAQSEKSPKSSASRLRSVSMVAGNGEVDGKQKTAWNTLKGR
jgi:hypothetical protein